MDAEAISVRELNHAALYVRDLNAAEYFYGQVLKLRPIPRPFFPFPGAWFALGQQELHLIADTMHLEDERHSVHFAFRVDDAYAAYEALLEADVHPLSVPSARSDGAVQVFLRDPDGYLIELVSFEHNKATPASRVGT